VVIDTTSETPFVAGRRVLRAAMRVPAEPMSVVVLRRESGGH
jgi:hypothetical protein